MGNNYIGAYANFLIRFFKLKRPIKVVFDCSDGTAGLVLKKILSDHKLPITSYLINSSPNGNFPAHGTDPLSYGALRDAARAVTKHKADMAAVFDADGDRAVFLDDLGREVTVDEATILIGENFPGPLVITELSGYLTRDWARKRGKKIFESRVGHLFIEKIMQAQKCAFAVENSGHYYFNKFFFRDSGILAAVHFMNQAARIMKQGIKLSDWIDALPKTYRIPETNFKVSDKRGVMGKVARHFRKSARRVSKLDGLRMDFGLKSAAPSEASAKEWWFSVRPSNTEDLLRLNLEAKEKKVLSQKFAELKQLITKTSQ